MSYRENRFYKREKRFVRKNFRPTGYKVKQTIHYNTRTGTNEASYTYVKTDGISTLLKLMGFFVMLLIFANLIGGYVGTTQVKTFEGLLHYITTDVPVIDFAWITTSANGFQISGSWGEFDGFRVFINMLGSILAVLMYALTGILNAISYVIWVFRYFVM